MWENLLLFKRMKSLHYYVLICFIELKFCLLQYNFQMDVEFIKNTFMPCSLQTFCEISKTKLIKDYRFKINHKRMTLDTGNMHLL